MYTSFVVLFIMLMSLVPMRAMVADYYIIIVALWSYYAYMIIHMHIYAFHMKLMAGHRHRAVTSTGTWSCMRGWHRPT